MKDFDFDELDRAVNSVLTKKQPAEETGVTEAVQDLPASDDNTDDHGIGSGMVTDAADDTTASDGIAATDMLSDDEAKSDHETTAISQTDESGPSEPSLFVPQLHPNDEPNQSESDSDSGSEASTVDEPAGAAEISDMDETVPTETTSDTKVDLLTSTDTDTDTAEDTSADNRSSFANIPVRRGRFMDVVAPQSAGGTDTPVKPLPTRSGVNLTPSTDFVDEHHTDLTEESSPATEQEPSLTEVDQPETETQLPVLPTVNQVTEESSTETEETAADEMPDNTADDNALSDDRNHTDAGQTPFIPDVPVEKRPLNALSSDEDEADSKNENDEKTTTNIDEPLLEVNGSPDTTLANVPKEFNEDIMAVESNENVGTPDESASATTQQHPMFDTSSMQSDETKPHGATSKMTWIIVGGSLFLVGAVLGVLYFLYGQA